MVVKKTETHPRFLRGISSSLVSGPLFSKFSDGGDVLRFFHSLIFLVSSLDGS